MTVVGYKFCVLSAWLAFISYADHRCNESAIFGDIPPPPPPPLYLPCSGRVDHWAKVARFPPLYSQLITAEFSINYLMVRYPNIKIYATEVKYRFLLLTSVYTLWYIMISRNYQGLMPSCHVLTFMQLRHGHGDKTAGIIQ